MVVFHEALKILRISLLAALGPVIVALWPQPREAMLVITSPFSGRDAMAVMAEADGKLISATSRASMVLARSDSDDFALRLIHAGAFLVLNGRFAAGCLSLAGRKP